MVSVTWWQLGAGAAGIILLIITLGNTRKATKTAIKATEVAQASVEVASDTAKRQLRAYVFFKGVRRTRRQNTDPWVIEATIQNFGQTPAYQAKMCVETLIVDASTEATLTLPEPTKKSATFDLAPGHAFTMRQEIPGLTGHMWSDFKAGKVVIFFWGRIDFVDAYNERRWIRFRKIQRGSYVLDFLYCDEGNDTSESTDDGTE